MSYCHFCGHEIEPGYEYLWNSYTAHQHCIIRNTAHCSHCHTDDIKDRMIAIEGTGKYICHDCYVNQQTAGERIAGILASRFEEPLLDNDGKIFEALIIHLRNTGERNVAKGLQAVLGRHRDIVDAVYREHNRSALSVMAETLWRMIRGK